VVGEEGLFASARPNRYRTLEGRKGANMKRILLAIGMPRSGTRVAGFNGAESNILLSKDLMKHRQFLQNIPGPRYLDGRTANGTVGLARI
jgi:hypothetical protein